MSVERRMQKAEDYGVGEKAYSSKEEEGLCWNERLVSVEVAEWLGKWALAEAMARILRRMWLSTVSNVIEV